MGEEELYAIVDFILNKADGDEIRVVQSALERRVKDDQNVLNMNPKKRAGRFANEAAKNVSYSVDQIRDLVRNYVVEMIRKQAPELDDKQVETLLEEWMPDKQKLEQDDASAQRVPPQALLHMVRQFVSFSLKRMPALEAAQLGNEIPDWQDKYWEGFPLRVKKLVYVFLEGKLEEDVFWDEVEQTVKGNR